MSKTIPLAIAAFVFFFIFLSSAQAYEVDFYAKANSGATYTIPNPSIQPDATTACVLNLNGKATLTSATNFDLSWGYYVPYSNLVTSGQLLGIANASCQDLGTTYGHSGFYDTNIYESRILETQTSTAGGYTQLKTTYSCLSSENKIQFRYRRDGAVDSSSQYLGAYYHSGGSNANNTIAGFGNMCTSVWNGNRFAPLQSAGCTNSNCGDAFIYPFKSPESGKVNISYDLSNSTYVCSASVQPSTVTYEIAIIKVSDYTILDNLAGSFTDTDSSPTCPAGSTYAYNLTLTPNEEYLLVFYDSVAHTFSPSGGMNVLVPNEVNITIDDRTPNYACGDYGNCTLGTKSRICIDQNGYFEDKIEFAACFLTAFEEQRIGFEQYNESGIYECKKDPWTCVSTPQPQTIKIPYGWTVGFSTRNLSGNLIDIPKFIDMVLPPKDNNSIDAVEGTLALAMWYDPPSVDDVVQDAPTTIACGNQSVGRIPTVRKDLNQTVFTDITFPSPYSTLSWSTRKMESPVVQYQVWTPYCYPFNELCYAPNCTSSMSGLYKVGLYTLSGGIIQDTIFEYFGDAGLNWNQIITDLSEYDLQPNTTYRLVFSVIPPNTDTYRLDGVGVYFDNVKVSNLPAALTGCEQFCNGTDLFVPRVSNGTCMFEVTINDSYCRTAQILPPGEVNASVFTPIGGNTTQSFFDATGFGVGSFFLTPFFIYIAIFLLIGAYADYKIQSGGLVFAIIMIFATIVGTFPQVGIIPLWFTIIFTIIAGAVAVYYMSNIFRGK